ncbi:hypothetical protein [Streptomyces aurantiogriseus]|uniref:Uncharacterized protein n=1 Tax=Streptomyces aurantiogriseus TaxID=66870 RepID=A0A918FPB1_9ACTN|nr:hypothetical protein [Streptomyces aurantiogriseus]GGR63364.1 hypothetical protein GCM10010251_94980 [Streptomyces aurantiogriseus]
MSTRTTFEDRLLAELRREVERRSSSAEEFTPEVPPARRRLLTGRRLALAAGVCAAAGLALALVPGSPADSPAYAVERNGDGTVTVTVQSRSLDRATQREFAERLRAEGVMVDITELPYGQQCKNPRGVPLRAESESSGFLSVSPAAPDTSASPQQLRSTAPAAPTHGKDLWNWTVVLHRGDSLAIENSDIPKDQHFGKTMSFMSAYKGKVSPCVPVSH